MGQELLRLDAPEIATLIRTHAHIPTVPNEDERERRLKQHLDKERNKARNEIFTAVQSILEDKSRKRDQGFTQPFVDLLFTENCLQEENESATLETITSISRAGGRHIALDRTLLAQPQLLTEFSDRDKTLLPK